MEWESRVSAGIHHWLNLCGSEPEFQLIKEKLLNLKEDLNEKLTVVVAGEFNAGKSTFINALLGSRILTSDVLPATAVVTKLTYGKSRRVIAHYRDKHMSEYDMKWLEQLTAEREGEFQQIRKNLSHIELQLPFELLKLFTIIDTPGLNSIHQEHTDTTDRFLPRADIVLWLFDYRNVSTSTEISSIKKLQGYDLEPFAIVNSIDKHEEDEEELESLLDENYRKLQRYVKKLIGVSAKDALEGKLAHDQELLKWSKWNQVEELFSSFKQLTDQKIVRIFQKLKEPLRMMDEILIGKKAELNLNHVGPLMKKFFDEEFPSLQRKAKQLDHLTVESNQKINSWNAFLNQEFEGLEKTTEFIRNANSRLSAEAQNNTGLLTDLDEKVLPQIKKFKNDYLQFEQEVNELKRERDLLNQEWKEADAASAFSRKHLRLTRHEEKQKDWNRKRVKLEKDHSQLLKLDRSIKDQFKQIGNMAEKAIIANIKETVEEQEHAAQSWNSMLTNAQQTYRTFTSADLENMRQFSEWMRSCLNGVITPFQEASAAMKDPLDFAETALLLSNIQSLYDDFPMDKLVQDFSVFQKWTKAKGVSYKIKINLPIPPEIKYKHIHFVPEKVSHDIEKAKNELIKKRREWLNWLATTAIITAIMIYAINYKDSSPSDGTAAAYEQSTNESSSSDTSSSKSSADLKENYGEDKIKDFIFSFDSERMESHTSTEFIHSVDVISDNKNSFRDYYERLEGYDTKNIDITNVEYPSDNRIHATADVVFQKAGKELVLELAFDFSPTVDNNNLIIESFSFSEKTAAVSEADIRSFLTTYRSEYITALNDINFSAVESYLEPQQPAYTEIRNFIQSLNGKGYSYTSETFDISKIEQAGPDLYKASTSEMFILEDANGQKTNNSRQKTYLIHVLGQNHFTIRDITEVSKSTTEVQDRTVGLVTDNDFDRFISGYYSNYAQAFNGSGFSTVATFYDPQTQEYKDTEANIADAISKQMKMNVVWSTVESSSVKDDSHYLVQVDSEIEYHYQNGTGDRKKLRTEFLIEVTPNAQLLIQSLPSMTILEKTSL